MPNLAEVVENLRIGERRNATLLISVDQFEEIFTIAEPAERTAFMDLVRWGTEATLPFMVVAIVRSDVLDELLQSRQFTVPFDSYALRPMPIERLPKIVEGPAEVAALSLEKGLVQRICDDVKTPEALPLLAFALRELYERYCKDHRLTVADYDKLGDAAAKLSPIENAVRRRADDVLSVMAASAIELAALKQAFIPHLVRITESNTFVRQQPNWPSYPRPRGGCSTP